MPKKIQDSVIIDVTTERKVRTPRNSNSIFAGALKLSLGEKVSLIKELKISVQGEVEAKTKQAEEAKAAINGL